MNRKGIGIGIKSICIMCFGLNALLGIFNNEKYLLLSGFYYFWVVAICFGGVWIIMQRRIHVRFDDIFFYIMLISLCIGVVIAGNSLSRGVFLSFVMIALAGIVICNLNLRYSDVLFLLQCIKYGALLFSMLMIIHPMDYWGGGWRYSVQNIRGDLIDPNYLGAVLVTGFAISLFLSYKSFGKKKVINIIYSIMLLSTSLLTGSRGAMLSVGVVVFFLYIQKCYDRKKSLKDIIYELVAFLGIIAIGLLVIKYLPERVFERFFLDSYNDGSNSRRIMLWMNTLEVIKQNFILGVGCVEEKISVGMESHNTYLSIWLDFGSIPFFVFISTVVRIIIKLVKKAQYLYLGCILQILISSGIIGAVFSQVFWLMVIISIVYLRLIESGNENG